MNCTQCGKPGAVEVNLAGTHLVRCAPCGFCWMADDAVRRLRECFDANTMRPFKATVNELKRRAKGASEAVLIKLTEELGGAEDLIFDEGSLLTFGLTATELTRQVADLNLLLADSSDPVSIEDQQASAAMLAETLAKKKGSGR